MIPIYRYSINGQRVYPIVSDDFSKNYELETGQQFFRQSLSGNLLLIRDDFDWVTSQDFNTVFVFLIEKSNNHGITWTSYFTGKFMFTDCKIDTDQKMITATVSSLDQYDTILSKLDDEFDIIRLGLSTNAVWYDKRPMIQIYSPGEDVVSNFLSGNYWEQTVINSVTSRSAILSTYKFAICNSFKEVVVTRNQGTPSDLGGFFFGSLSVSGNTMQGSLLTAEDNGYRFYISMVGKDADFTTYDNMVISVYNSSNVELFRATVSDDGEYDTQTLTLSAVSGSGATGTITVDITTKNIYGRYLLDASTLNGSNTHDFPLDDITDNVQNFRKVIGYGLNVGYISRNWAETPTEWGRVSGQDSAYYDKPITFLEQEFFPIARSTWSDYSYWFGFYYSDPALEKMGRVVHQIKDAYLLSSVIASLLSQIDSTLTFLPTEEYSQFLYGSVNPISSLGFELIIAPKSNATIGQYDQAAQKAPITLGNVLNMLRNCFRCYWYIEDGKLRIEHIKFFRNGGTYNDDPPSYSVDLTVLQNTRLQKPWGFNMNSYYFDKDKMPEKYKFSWADTSTKAFEGYPILINSPYVQKGSSEDISVSGFSTDIDYMQLNPDEISKDGFALFAGKPAEMFALYDEYLGYFDTSANAGYSEYIRLRNGRGWDNVRRGVAIPCKMTIRVSGTSAGSGEIQFFRADGYNPDWPEVPEVSFPITTTPTTMVIDVVFPACMYIRFYANVNATIRVYSCLAEGEYQLPYVRRTISGLEYNMQNGYLSWTSLMQYYLIDLPAKHCTINEEEVELGTTARNKKQTVTFPSIDDPDLQKTIKTSLGYGQIEKLSVNLSTRMNDITLKYDTE